MTQSTWGERVEGVAQVVILLAIGSMAAAASFTHVHNVAAAHGQPGWLAWADAVVLELMSIATGLEIRRRHRAGRAAGFVTWVLVGAVALSLSAQVVEAERSVIGWLAAALPAGGFLALVKIVLTRTPTGTGSVRVQDGDLGAQDDRDYQLRAELPTGTDAAIVLHRQDIRSGVVPVPPDAFARANGANVHSGVAQ